MKKKICFAIIFMTMFGIFVSGCTNESMIQKAARSLSDYSLTLFYNDEDHTISGSLELSFINNFDQPITSMVFSLWANAFAEDVKYGPVSATNSAKAYPNGKSYGKIDVSDVKVNGSDVQNIVGGQDNTSLTITLPKTIYETETARVNMNFVSVVPNGNLRFSYGENTVNLTGFFPILAVYTKDGWVANPYSPNGDPFFTECSNFKVQISYGSDYKIASTGVQAMTETTNGVTRTFISADAVRDFAIILSKEFQMIEKEENETMVKYYYFNDEDPNLSLNVSAQSVKTYEELYGVYPYDTLSVVQSNFVHGGMEYPTLVMISSTLNSREEQNEVIAHEIAHQWWYGMVGSDAFQHGWMDEGLTEFSTALFFQKNQQYGISKTEMIKNANKSYLLFVDVYSEVFGTIDTSMDRALNDFKTEPEYVYTAYVKSLLMFDNLFELLGERKFLAGAQSLVKNNRFKNIEPEDMISAFQKANRTSLEGFFDSWLSGKVAIIGQ